MQGNMFANGSFEADGATWRVSINGQWIMLASEDGEVINHVNPTSAWIKEVQDAAKEYLKNS